MKARAPEAGWAKVLELAQSAANHFRMDGGLAGTQGFEPR